MSFSSLIYMTQGKGPTAPVRLLNGCGHDSQMTTTLASLLHRSSDIQSNPTTTASSPSFHMALPVVSKAIFISTSLGTFFFASTLFFKSFNHFPTSPLKLPFSLCFICQDLLDRHQQTPEPSEQQTS